MSILCPLDMLIHIVNVLFNRAESIDFSFIEVYIYTLPSRLSRVRVSSSANKKDSLKGESFLFGMTETRTPSVQALYRVRATCEQSAKCFCCILMSSLLGSKIIELSCWICFSILPIECVYYILVRPWNKLRVTIRSEVCIFKLLQKWLLLLTKFFFYTPLTPASPTLSHKGRG